MNWTEKQKKRERFREAAQNVLWSKGNYEDHRVEIKFYNLVDEQGMEIVRKKMPDSDHESLRITDNPVVYVMNNGDVIRHHGEYTAIHDHVIDLEDELVVIDSFKGYNKFLSNFYEHPLEFVGVEWPTSEHAYQAMKTLDPDERDVVRKASTPGKAKRAGRKVTLRDDWDDVKVDIMYKILKAKFSDDEMSAALASTGHALLIEGNHWGDKFWGVCKGEGENWLGRLLMKIRRSI